MYSRILIPMDGSEAAEIVLPYVEEIAARSGSEMILASVSETENAELERMYQPYLEELSSKVESELEVWRAKGGTTVQYAIIMGTPASEIVRYADENDVKLIAMASRGSSGQGPWLLGNIAAKVLRSTSKPVLLIRKPVSEVDLQQKNLIKRVLLPLDGSELGEGA
ncbi:MAG: universal stress protein, partial [Chloroflexota bacterium]|nr:universal stress protein [Chloroflexota bacterium]